MDTFTIRFLDERPDLVVDGDGAIEEGPGPDSTMRVLRIWAGGVDKIVFEVPVRELHGYERFVRVSHYERKL